MTYSWVSSAYTWYSKPFPDYVTQLNCMQRKKQRPKNEHKVIRVTSLVILLIIIKLV